MNLDEGSPIIDGLLAAYNEVQKHKQDMDKTIDDAMNKIRLARDLLLITGQIIKEERQPKPLPAPKKPKRKDSSSDSSSDSEIKIDSVSITELESETKEEEEEEEDKVEYAIDYCVYYIWDRIRAAMGELDPVIAGFSQNNDMTETAMSIRAAHMHLRRANNFIAEMFENNPPGLDTIIRVPSYMTADIEEFEQDREAEEKSKNDPLSSGPDTDNVEEEEEEKPEKPKEEPKPQPTPKSEPVIDKISDLIEGSSDSEDKPEVPYKCLLVKKNKVVIAKWYFKYRKAWQKALKTAKLFDGHKYMKKVVSMLESPAKNLEELKDDVENAIKACQNWIKISTPEDFDWINGQAVLKQLTKMEWIVDEAISA